MTATPFDALKAQQTVQHYQKTSQSINPSTGAATPGTLTFISTFSAVINDSFSKGAPKETPSGHVYQLSGQRSISTEYQLQTGDVVVITEPSGSTSRWSVSTIKANHALISKLTDSTWSTYILTYLDDGTDPAQTEPVTGTTYEEWG